MELKGLLASEYYISCKAGFPLLPITSNQDKARALTAVKCFDMVATAEQLAIITAVAPHRDDMAVHNTVTDIHNLFYARLFLAYQEQKLELTPQMLKFAPLKINSITERLVLVTKSNDKAANDRFTSDALSAEDRFKCMALMPVRAAATAAADGKAKKKRIAAAGRAASMGVAAAPAATVGRSGAPVKRKRESPAVAAAAGAALATSTAATAEQPPSVAVTAAASSSTAVPALMKESIWKGFFRSSH